MFRGEAFFFFLRLCSVVRYMSVWKGTEMGDSKKYPLCKDAAVTLKTRARGRIDVAEKDRKGFDPLCTRLCNGS